MSGNRSKSNKGGSPQRKASASTQQDKEPGEAGGVKRQCGLCNLNLGKKDKFLQCELCDLWFHTTCQDVSEAMYAVVLEARELKKPGIHWYCAPSCDRAAEKFLKGIRQLQDDVQSLQNDMVSTNEKIDKISSGDLPQGMVDAVSSISTKVGADMKQKVNSEIGNVKTELAKIAAGEFPKAMAEAVAKLSSERGPASGDEQSANLDPNEVQSMIDKKTKEHLLELDDRNRRRTNLLVFKLRESTEDSKEAKKKEDVAMAHQILKDIQSTHKPTDIRRLGNPAAEQTRPRPLRISFNSQEERDMVIRNFHKSKKSAENDKDKNSVGNENETDEPLISKIAMRKDFTPLERKEEDELYATLRAKREESEQSGDGHAFWVRKKNQIVNVGRYPPGAPGGNWG